MEGKDNIEELFSDKLGNYEAQVNPEMWAKVASQIGASSAAVGVGVSVLTKWLIGIGVSAAAVTTAAIVISSSDVNKQNPITETSREKQEQAIKEVVSGTINQTDSKAPTTPAKKIEQENSILPVVVAPIKRKTAPFVDLTPEELLIGTVMTVEKKAINSPLITSPFTEPPKEEPKTEARLEMKPRVIAVPSFTIAQYTNIFSPNGDRVNDEFYLEINGVVDFYIIVINNLGEAVFKSDEADFRWKGRNFRDEAVPVGEYVYMISGRDKDGNPIAQTKSLTITR